MPAVRAFAEIRPACRAVDGVATNTAEGGFSARVFEKRVIAAIVESPKAEEHTRDEKAESSRSGDEVHGVRVRGPTSLTRLR